MRRENVGTIHYTIHNSRDESGDTVTGIIILQEDKQDVVTGHEMDYITGLITTIMGPSSTCREAQLDDEEKFQRSSETLRRLRVTK